MRSIIVHYDDPKIQEGRGGFVKEDLEGEIVNCDNCEKEVGRVSKNVNETISGYFCSWNCYYKEHPIVIYKRKVITPETKKVSEVKKVQIEKPPVLVCSVCNGRAWGRGFIHQKDCPNK